MSEFVGKMKLQLEEMKQGILDNLRAENNEFDVLVNNKCPKDMVDIASEDIDRGILEALSSGEVKRLKLIESALGRLHSGHYGNCFHCGANIDRARLNAIPYALFCISCKSHTESK